MVESEGAVRYYKEKLCPGCNKMKSFRKADGVCGGCKRKIKDYDRIKTAIDNTPHQIMCTMPSVDYALKYYYKHKTHISTKSQMENLHKAMFNLAWELSDPVPYEDKFNNIPAPCLFETLANERHHRAVRYIDKKVFNLIRELDIAINNYGMLANKEGYQKGSDLLKKLASGEITVHEFDAKTKEG